MKKYLKYITGGVLIVLAGCGEFGDTNENPNASETPLTSALLTNAISGLSSAVSSTRPSLYCQYISETQYTETSRYQIGAVDWSGELAGSIYDLQNIININSDPSTAASAALVGSNANQIAIARILKAYRFSVLTDRYGDMPYSQALKSEPQPKFDSQDSIYIDLFKELGEAVDQFEEDGETVQGDILLDGDVARWKKFANSWRLVLALRVSNAAPALAAEQIAAALGADGGLITSNAENVVLTYPGDGNYNSPWYSVSGDFSISGTIADMLNTLGDARVNAYGNPVNGTLIGVPYGLQRQDAINWTAANTNWSLVLNTAYRGMDGSINLVTFADVLLALAEASQNGLVTLSGTVASTYGATTEEVYNNGIKASWEQWNVYDATVYADYIAQSSVALSAGDEDEKIGTQRWLAFFPNGYQGWSEWRRTGYPTLSPASEPLNNSKQIPVRYMYPTDEYNLNKTNLQDAIDKLQEGDTDSSPLWWDVNN